MGRIKTKLIVKAPVDRVFEIGRDVSQYTAICTNLKEVKAIEQSDDRSAVRTKWKAEARLLSLKRTISWVQDDAWDEEKKRCDFSLNRDFKTRFKKMEGCWIFNPHEKGTEMIMDVDFYLEHPLLNGRVHKVVDGIMKKNNETLMRGIKKKAEKG